MALSCTKTNKNLYVNLFNSRESRNLRHFVSVEFTRGTQIYSQSGKKGLYTV